MDPISSRGSLGLSLMICVMVDIDLESKKGTNDEYPAGPNASFRNADK